MGRAASVSDKWLYDMMGYKVGVRSGKLAIIFVYISKAGRRTFLFFCAFYQNVFIVLVLFPGLSMYVPSIAAEAQVLFLYVHDGNSAVHWMFLFFVSA